MRFFTGKFFVKKMFVINALKTLYFPNLMGLLRRSVDLMNDYEFLKDPHANLLFQFFSKKRLKNPQMMVFNQLTAIMVWQATVACRPVRKKEKKVRKNRRTSLGMRDGGALGMR